MEKKEKYLPRLLEHYRKNVVPTLMEKFKYKNILQVPRLKKISVNIGSGESVENPKMMETFIKELAQITGQKPVITKSKKSISNFKLRKGMNIGCKVTLRRTRMYEFLDRFISIAVPRIRDFRGLSDKSFDGRGNYSVGIKEQIIFPEINYDDIQKIKGMDISIITTANTDEEAYELLKELGMPFRKK